MYKIKLITNFMYTQARYYYKEEVLSVNCIWQFYRDLKFPWGSVRILRAASSGRTKPHHTCKKWQYKMYVWYLSKIKAHLKVRDNIALIHYDTIHVCIHVNMTYRKMGLTFLKCLKKDNVKLTALIFKLSLLGTNVHMKGI